VYNNAVNFSGSLYWGKNFRMASEIKLNKIVRTILKTKSREIRADQLMIVFTTMLILALISFSIYIIFLQMKAMAVQDAKDKAEILLRHNLAIHSYFADQLKPAVRKDMDGFSSSDSFQPAWMSSTYAVREIDREFKKSEVFSDYYYKEAAINARSPQNEADEFEREFLLQLNRDPNLQETTAIRIYGGVPYFVIMMRGETMDEGCMQCHSSPGLAPAEMVSWYGGTRSFHRDVGEVVSAVSIRVPIAVTTAWAKAYLFPLAGVIAALLLGAFMLMIALSQRLIFQPLNTIREKALEIASNKSALGQQILPPFGSEMRMLTEAFNQMSWSLRKHEDQLAETIRSRTIALEDTTHFLERVLGSIPDQVLVVSFPTTRLIYANKEAMNFWQIQHADYGKNICDLIHSRQTTEDTQDCAWFWGELQQVENGHMIEKDQQILNAERLPRWLHWRGMVYMRDDNGRPEQILLILDDITKQKAAEEKLLYLGRHDPLTGVYNRGWFEEMMRETSSRDSFPATVLMADVDNLKALNDTHGHNAGDEYLQALAHTLVDSLRKDDVVARIGGDEFAALLPGIDTDRAGQVIARIEEKLAPIHARYERLRLGLSIGCATIHNRKELESALKLADEAMYQEKASRKICVVDF
jgi:diguanylate cyclase (GGDEF)-like protein